FKTAFAGLKNIYLIAYDRADQPSGGWQTLGSWTVTSATAPNAVTVSPNSGSGPGQVFTATYGDALGYGDISEAQLLVNSTLNGASACYARWTPAGFWLRNDSATTWLGPISAGSSGILQ